MTNEELNKRLKDNADAISRSPLGKKFNKDYNSKVVDNVRLKLTGEKIKLKIKHFNINEFKKFYDEIA